MENKNLRGNGAAKTNGKKEDDYLDYVQDEDENCEQEEHDPRVARLARTNQKMGGITGNKNLIEEVMLQDPNEDPLEGHGPKRIVDREDEYHQGRLRRRELSPERVDAFRVPDLQKNNQNGQKNQTGVKRTYRDIMADQQLENDVSDVKRQLEKKAQEQDQKKDEDPLRGAPKRPRLDNQDDKTSTAGVSIKSHMPPTDWDKKEAGPVTKAAVEKSIRTASKWDTPLRAPGSVAATPRRNRWDLTPAGVHETPGRSQIQETPTPGRWGGLSTPQRLISETPTPGASRFGVTPMAGSANRWEQSSQIETESVKSHSASTVDGITSTLSNWEQETLARNRPLTNAELDMMLPTQGYEIVAPPEGYQPVERGEEEPVADGYSLPASESKPYEIPSSSIPASESDALPFIKPEEINYFSALLEEVDEDQLSGEEIRERRIMMLLLKVKNGTPPMRKQALKTVTERAREFGAGPLFNQILPLLMSPTLEDQERHLLVKVIDRILYKLDDLVRPYVHKILVVIEPLLIDEDYYARVEGREIISNLAKAAGLATMIATMRPDIDHNDEYVRNTTARAFAVIASALGVPQLLPFLKAVCQSKKSWRARHTGIKIIQQIGILMGCAILPHLKNLVDIVEHGLKDEEPKVRTITALALSALAEASNPYGIEAFDSVLIPLWDGTSMYRGKALAAFLKAIGYIIPLMDPDQAGEYTKFVTPVLIREFQNPDDEMKKIVLKVVKQCVATEGVSVGFIREEIVPGFFSNFWIRRNAVDKKNYRQLIETTVELASKVGGAEIIRKIVEELKDENESYRKIVMETIERIVATVGVADIDSKLEERLMEGILFAFQEQASEDTQVVLNAFGTIVNCLGSRTKPYIPQIVGIIQWTLHNKSARVRQQAADLIQRIAVVMKACGEEGLMGRLGVILYEYLGEEYPEVLGSILGGLKAIVNVIGMPKMTPPIKDLLPRLTPILKNRHEKVQENCIDLVGRIADRGAEYVSAREWMRICFDLLDLLKAHKKGIRRATVNTFGYIAKAIGPQDVLATLLNNLRVQERQNRVCTTVAIAIVAETCGPFTVLPALMNEYRVPEMNVQNGVLKSLSFMFEYVGEMGKDYIYAVTPLLEDALIDRDLVHRQTAASAVKHLALGVAYLGCEDALAHLLNYLFPNLFEVSPHVINAVLDGIEGLRVALGPARILAYVLQGLFHPARRVREVYWKIFNNMYLASQDALVAAYPEIEEDPNRFQEISSSTSPQPQVQNYYIREELCLLI